MDREQLHELVEKIQKQRTELPNLEIKAAREGCPTKLYDTISSFANQDNGGVILFGISEDDNYEIVGVYDANDLQKKVTSVCGNMSTKVRPVFSVEDFDDKVVVAAEIYAADYDLRPVFYLPRGKAAGSYIRVGDADEPMTPAEIYAYDAFRGRIKDDARVPDDSEWKLLNEDRLHEYIREVKRSRENLSRNVSDEEILELMGVTRKGLPTLAGIMVFSSYPQSFFPNLTINAVVVPGEEIGELGLQGERFTNNKKITGAIPDMLDLAMDFVYNNQKVKTIINEKGKREDKLEYPMKAVREAILNALVHRDYSRYSENTPITLNMYSNRIEITNPGGLFGSLTIDNLGRIRPETRNGILADILEILRYTENRYSGIPTMRAEMKNLGLSDPEFKAERGTFKTIFYNAVVKEDNGNSIKDKIYSFCKEPRTREEIMKLTGLSRYYAINVIVKEMIEDGKIGLTIPESPKSKNQRYYSK